MMMLTCNGNNITLIYFHYIFYTLEIIIDCFCLSFIFGPAMKRRLVQGFTLPRHLVTDPHNLECREKCVLKVDGRLFIHISIVIYRTMKINDD